MAGRLPGRLGRTFRVSLFNTPGKQCPNSVVNVELARPTFPRQTFYRSFLMGLETANAGRHVHDDRVGEGTAGDEARWCGAPSLLRLTSGRLFRPAEEGERPWATVRRIVSGDVMGWFSIIVDRRRALGLWRRRRRGAPRGEALADGPRNNTADRARSVSRLDIGSWLNPSQQRAIDDA